MDSDIVVLYGPNGLGKTSFFDAIDYLSTGRIGRLGRGRQDHAQFVDLARHLDAPEDLGSVTMDVESSLSRFSLRRTVKDWSNAIVESETLDRAGVLERLTLANWGDKKERVENLVNLFRATHLFSQTDPELLMEFKNSGALSQDLVSRMLALEDYSTGRDKVEGVLSVLRTQINKNQKRLAELNDKIKDAKGRLKQVPGPKESVKAGKQLEKLATDLITELKGETGLEIASEEATSDSVREWRALIDAELKNSRGALERVRSLESGFSLFEENTEALKETVSKLKSLAKESKGKETNHEQLQKKRKEYSALFDKNKTEISDIQAGRKTYEELVRLLDEKRSAKASLAPWNKEIKRLNEEASASSANLVELVPQAEELAAKRDDYRRKIDAKSELAQSLTKIRSDRESWEVARQEGAALKQSIASSRTEIRGLQKSLDKKQRAIDAKVIELKECEDDYRKLTENQTDLTRLLDEIEAHVVDAVCPTCATDHGTKKNLIKKIRAQKQSRPARAEEVAILRRELSKLIEEDSNSKKTFEKILETASRTLEKLERRLEKNRKVSASFESTLAEVGLEAEDPNLTTQIEKRLNEVGGALQALESDFLQIETEKADKDGAIEALRNKLSRNSETLSRAKESSAPLEQGVHNLQNEAEALDLPLDLKPSQVTKKIEVLTAQETKSDKRRSDLNRELDSLELDLKKLEAELAELTKAQEILKQERKLLEDEIATYTDEAANVLEGDSVELDNIVEERRQVAERTKVLERLHRRALTLERSLDSKQQTVIIAELGADIEASNAEKQQLNEESRRASDNEKWFSQIADLLSEHNIGAIKQYVQAHGPLTSLIQKRLRSVYGFSDISLRTKGKEIQVFVNRKDRELKPTEYFSESQNQILMLSLFLAGRLTQTWSAFSPILLDDPVTHFDDVNAYGFVELIRGIANTSPGKRQFFISVCEEKLFHVMRKKFRNVEGGCRFYRFEGIGVDGPVVGEIGRK